MVFQGHLRPSLGVFAIEDIRKISRQGRRTSSRAATFPTVLKGVFVQAGVFNYTGFYEESILHAGDVGLAPVSSAHYFKNVGSTDCFVVLIFNAGRFTNIDATALVGNMPAEVS